MNVSKFSATLLETLGIDLIPYAIGTAKFHSGPPFEPTKLNQIREQLHGLDVKKLDDALKFSKELLDEESNRGEKAESKAFSLIGVIGISAAFITGISSLLPKENQIPFFLSLALLISYLVIVISLTLTVLLASRVVKVRAYTRPDMADVFKMSSQSLTEAKKDRLSVYMKSYADNNQIHNIKMSYLIGAQLWFRNSVIMFLVLSLILIISLSNGAISNTQPFISGTPSLISPARQTQTLITVVQTAPVPHLTAQAPTNAITTETPTSSP